MSQSVRIILLYSLMFAALVAVGFAQSWPLALAILNMCLISGIMALGVNIQWGYAGLFNVGIMGFAALGGVAAVLVSEPIRGEAWSVGGLGLVASFLSILAAAVAVGWVRKHLPQRGRGLITVLLLIAGYAAARQFFGPAVGAIEALDPTIYGNIGGAGLPVIFSWLVGGLFAGGAAFLISRIALGLRSDYLAIATLGISEIVLAVLKNEDWLARGVKNVSGLDSPVPSAIELQASDWFISFAADIGMTTIEASTVFVRGSYTLLFVIVLALLMWLTERALHSPWGRMMRAIRDNRDAAEAMGKDVVARHRQVFILGSAVVGIAGAMLVTMDGLFTPGTYNPLRYTFLIWVMVIVGGSGNNWGAVLGGFLIWFTWTQAENWGPQAMEFVTSGMAGDSALRLHLMDNAPHMRLMIMGLVLLITLRFFPKGLIPEQIRR
ncbi:branched-chain amino acid transport system permease protein [Monaibacterium marinum]|uniref:Branched-chain amino acid transport system permease protein n=1 Tax=Pontivivens marinum TaxID=1690039 RepID=A0A2C9CP14_9RHOB|nr:branched-chain amino acid ABC transporter permease [Monaibacterium marinum]SOH92947.1 branched-chain amino acid transport system permease protein [Monaibacterium marinum]